MDLFLPIANTNSVVRIQLSPQDSQEHVSTILEILSAEISPLSLWLRIAVEYLRLGRLDHFQDIIRASILPEVEKHYPRSENDRIMLLNSMASFLTRQAFVERSSERKTALIKESVNLFSRARQIDDTESTTWVSRGLFNLLQNNVDGALIQFTTILNRDTEDVAALLGKAASKFRKKQYRQALSCYQTILKKNPDCQPCIRLGIGLCAFKLGALDLAFDAFERTYELDSESIDALVGLSVVELSKSRISIEDQADHLSNSLEYAMRAHKLDPVHPIVTNILCEHFFYRGDFAKVEILAKRVQRTLRNYHGEESDVQRIQAENQYQLGRLYHVKGELSRALSYYEEASSLWPENDRIKFTTAQMTLLLSSEYDKAIKQLESVKDKNPDFFDVKKILGSYYAKIGNSDQASSILQKAWKLRPKDFEVSVECAQMFELKDPLEALAIYERVLDYLKRKSLKIPFQLLNNMAALQHERKQWKKSFDMYRDAFLSFDGELKDGPPTITYNIGLLYECEGYLDKAKEMYKKIVEQDQEIGSETSCSYVDAYLRLASLSIREGDTKTAIATYEKVLQAHSNNIECILALGDLYFKEENYDEALKNFRKVTAVNPLNEYAQLSIANVKFVLNQNLRKSSDSKKKHIAKKALQNAEEIYLSILKQNPHNIYAANGVGAVLAAREHLDSAEEVFLQIRESTTDVSPVLINLAHIAMKQRQYQKALRYYETCLKRFGREADLTLLLYIARAHFFSNDLPQAKKTLQKALLTNPNVTFTWFNLALVSEEYCVECLQTTKDKSEVDIDRVMAGHESLKHTKQIFDVLAKSQSSNSIVRKQAKEYYGHCKRLESRAVKHVDYAQKKAKKVMELKKRQQDKIRVAQEKREREEELKAQEELRLREQFEEQAVEQAARIQALQQQWSERHKSSQQKKKKSKKAQNSDEDDGSEPDTSDEDDETSLYQSPTSPPKKGQKRDQETANIEGSPTSKKRRLQKAVESSDDE